MFSFQVKARSSRAYYVTALAFVLVTIIGTCGHHLFGPNVGLGRSALWALTAIPTFDYGLDPPELTAFSVFKVCLLWLAFFLLVMVGTVTVPPAIKWAEAPSKGLAVIQVIKGTLLFLIVGPVDWEKVLSIFRRMREQYAQAHLVVVVSERLTEIPPELMAMGIQFVHGSLRDPATYARAGIEHATGVFVCAESYQEPGVDANTAGYVHVIESAYPAVRTVVEVVSEADNAYMFDGETGADRRVSFDPLTLAAVAKMVAEQLNGAEANVIGLPENEEEERRTDDKEKIGVDRAQRAELRRQLEVAGVRLSREGRRVKIILPKDLDNPTGTTANPVGSDAQVWAELKLADKEEEETVVIVGMYLSVLSDYLFRGRRYAVCADRIMADAEVAVMFAP